MRNGQLRIHIGYAIVVSLPNKFIFSGADLGGGCRGCAGGVCTPPPRPELKLAYLLFDLTGQ